MKNTLVDLRGKTLEKVLEILENADINDVHSEGGWSNISHLYSKTIEKGDYTEIISVWISSTHRPKVDLILWNGERVPWRPDCDLHGFIRKDGSIDWEQRNTINIMR